MYVMMNTLICDPEELTYIDQTWSLLMSTYGKQCIESGRVSKDFLNMMDQHQKCEKTPECSVTVLHCFPESMNPKEICG